MIHKFKIALLLIALSVPASLALAMDEQSFNTSPQGWFFSAGRSYLGVTIRDVTADRLDALKLKEERGVEITMVDQDAPAGKAGLKEHDVILEFNGTRVESEQQIRRLISETPPGRNVTLAISRDGAPMTVQVQIGDREKIMAASGHQQAHESMELLLPRMQELHEFNFDLQSPTLGVQVEPLGHQLAEYFGVKSGDGLLVKSVEKDSVAEKAGIKTGDVITHANKEKINDRVELRRVLRAHQGSKVTLGIVRDKREQNITVDLPARKTRDSSVLEFKVPDEQVLEEIKTRLRELKPQIDQEIREKLKNLEPQLKKARMMVNDFGPQLEQAKKAMLQAQSALERTRKEMDKQKLEWKLKFRESQMI